MTERRKIIDRDIKESKQNGRGSQPTGACIIFLSFRDLGMYIVTIYIHVPRSLKLKKKYDTCILG